MTIDYTENVIFLSKYHDYVPNYDTPEFNIQAK